ncbi:MOSC domain-containing protein [Stutzerimonas urumqiensis]|uniref:MOSC domain-containing protein n=1 Tax=Stutzerimonas urumqiensis TaxID=638269 RepID=UPI000EAE8138|nr:MOSC domain-containing protein [Stutzerimonas urumqiensis]
MELSSIYRFPVKSAAGHALQRAEADALGLVGDRRWMVVAADSGRFLTQRVLPQMARIQPQWLGGDGLLLRAPGLPDLPVALPGRGAEARLVTIWGRQVSAPDAGNAAADWLGQALGRPCRLVYLPAEQGLQVDLDYASPGDKAAFSDGFPFLLIGQSSLDDLSARVGRALDMIRFRPNLVVAGAAPFAEDDWRRIRIGDMTFRVAKPCSRCVIPTVDPVTGERAADGEPLATLMRYRKREGGVFFGQNLIADGPGVLDVGMPVERLE